jgi:hypothetical protein
MPRLQLAMPSSVWSRPPALAVQAEPTTIDPSPGTTAPPLCETIVGQPLYAGQDTWVTQTHWQCANLSR